MSQPAPVAVPVKRGMSPLVVVLLVLGGLFVLCIVAVVGAGLFAAHKLKEAGISTELLRREPSMAIGKLITAANPDAEVLRTDDKAGTITIRDRKTGKIVTLSFDDIKSGKFNVKVQGDDGQTATMEFVGTDGKLPSWVPTYPGSSAKGNFAVKGNSADGAAEGGNYTFTTSDSGAKVFSFYQDKAKELGMKVNLSSAADQGGMIVATDEDSKRSITVVVGSNGGETTVNVTYGKKL